MWELDHKENWVPKNWCFWTMMLEKTLDSLWTTRRSNQSVLKEINPEYSLKGLMLKLKLQYLGNLMWRADSLEKTLMLGKIEGRRRRGNRGSDDWMASSTQWTITSEQILVDNEALAPGMLQSMGVAKSNWTTATTILCLAFCKRKQT